MVRTSISIHNVMCPTDFSECAASAFAESVRWARWFGAKITVLHVIPPAIPTSVDMGYLPVPDGIGDAVRQEKLEELRRFVEANEHHGIRVETLCREGEAPRQIRAAVRETGADLIVMGTHGRSGLGRLMLGSVTEAMLTDAPVPVLTVHRGAAAGGNGLFRRVLCATDASEWSAGTIAFAIELAGEDAEHLTVLNVIEDLPETWAWAQGHYALREVEAFRADLELAAIAELQKRIPDEARVSCRLEEHVAFGRPDREILRVAAEEGADLIVMGTHGHGALDRALFGSTVRRVVRAATCPVAVFPAGHLWPATGLVRHYTAEPVGAHRVPAAEGGLP